MPDHERRVTHRAADRCGGRRACDTSRRMTKRGLGDDFDEARSGMVHREPIAPISDHFAESSSEYAGAVGCISVQSFWRSWRARRRNRKRATPSSRVARNSRYTPPKP